MTVNRTTLLDLPLPVSGTESGTWGDTTNNGLTQYVDIAVAGMNSLTSANFTAGALTLANTTGDSSATNIAAGSAQYGAIKVSSLATNSTITAPSSNRRYTIINADATYSVTIKASGQTGVVIVAGEKALVAFNGTDYVKIATANGTGEFTTVDTTNLEVTNIKAKDGTAAATIADSTGIITVSTQLNVDNLNFSVNTISSTDTNGNIVLAPNGTGDVQVDADTLRVGDSGAAATITTNGAGNLTINTNTGTNSGSIVINQGANGNIEVAPNGTGDVYLTADTVRIGDSAANATLTTNGAGDLILNTNAGTNSGFITIANGTNGNITITPDGTGEVAMSKVNIDGGAIDNTAIGASTASAGRFSSLADTGLTSGRVTYATTGGELTDSANLTFNGTDLTVSGAVNAGSVNATTLDLTNLEVTNIKAKDGTASASIADSTGVMTIGSSVLTTTDINGGTIDGTTIGGASAAAGTFTTATATTGNITTVNATTVDTTNVEVTNIKAKDGTAAMSIADSTGIVTVSTQLQVDNLNVSGNTISSTDTNGNIVLAPNGTGDVQVDADTLRVGDSGAAATITTNGAGNLTISTNEGTNSGTIVINQGTNGNIEVAPNGTGDVYLTSDTVRIGDSNANATLTTNGTGDLILNTNSGTNSGSITIADGAGGDITATPNGNGSVVITNSGTSNALRITQTGSGNALLVEDSANPDATPVVIRADGRTVIGGTEPYNGTGGYPVGFSQYAINGESIFARYTNDANSTRIELAKSRGASVGSQGIVSNGDGLGIIAWSASDGANLITAAQISSEVDGTPGTNDMPGRLRFFTTADGASTPTERVRINSAGLTTVGINASTGAALSTTVAAKLLSANTTYTDSATAASGTVTHGTINSFDNPAIAASNASVTYTNASTVYIDGAPTAGSNVTITNPYSLYVNGGTVYFGGTVSAADPIVQQTDIGTAPNEIPLNQYLGALAYENSEWVAPQVGSGITGGTGTICKTSFATQGGIKVMQILIDLTGLNSGGTAGDIIGVNGTSNPCYIAQIPSTYTVLGGRMTCLETPAGGDTDIDLYSAVEGTGVEDQAITALTETQIINAGTQSIGTVTYFAADPAANTYFYLVGQGTSNTTYTAGRFLIEVFGA